MEEKEFKERKKSNRAIKKLEKQGKVQSICGFLQLPEDKDDEWVQSKKEKFVRNRSLRSCTRRVRKAVVSLLLVTKVISLLDMISLTKRSKYEKEVRVDCTSLVGFPRSVRL